MNGFISLETRNTLLSNCLSASAPIYRNLFGLSTISVESEDAWEKLPFLTKDFLRTIPIDDRLFIPWKNVAGFFHSSGTSGRPVVFMPRTVHPYYSEWKKEYLSNIGSILACQFPLLPSVRERTLRSFGWEGQVVLFDPYNPRMSVLVAKAANCNALMLPPHMCADAATYLISEGLTDEIRHIELSGGEPCTQALFAFLKSTFKNAIITYYYNCSEIELAPFGIPCEPMYDGDILERFHVQEGHHMELVDLHTEKVIPVKSGAEGELIVSSFSEKPTAFPLIRYRTGDIARMHGTCSKHGAPLFAIVGRAELDFVKVATGQIRADAISKALRSMTPPLSDDFEFHYYPIGAHDRTHSLLKMYDASPADPQLAERLMKMIPVSATQCYHDYMSEGLVLPLSIEFASDKRTTKARRILRHDI